MAVSAPPPPAVEIDDGVIEEARRRQRRRRFGIAGGLAAAAAIGAGLVLLLWGGGSGSAGGRGQPERAPRGAAPFTPKLRRGQAWYTEQVIVRMFPAYARLRSRQVWSWEAWNGAGGSVWGGISTGGGGPGFVGPPGFGEWSASWIPRSALRSPTTFLRALDRAGGYFNYNVPGRSPVEDTDRSPLTKLAEAAALLGEVQLRPSQRAIVLRAIAQLPGLAHLGRVRDPLGRPGVAVAAQGSPRALDTNAHQRYRLELIFDPSTANVLGIRTIALKAVRVSAKRSEGVPTATHVQAGQVMFSMAYKHEGVIAAAKLPSLVCATSRFPRARCESLITNSINKHH